MGANRVRAMGVLAMLVCAAMLASAGVAGAARFFVRVDIAADLSAGDVGEDIAGTSTLRYRCDERRTLTNRIWFERRAAGGEDWRRIEPAQVRYDVARFADPHRPGARVRRASVQAPRSSFAGGAAFEFRLHSRATFNCAGHKVVARSQTLALPGLGA
jgi:hypothetical protein